MSETGKTKIIVPWRIPPSASQVRNWHRWPEINFQKCPDDLRLEAALSFAPGTLTILRKAFEARLSRFTGWKLTQSTTRAHRDAARIFRRGVFLEGDDQLSPPMNQSSGRYFITLHESQPSIDAKTAQSSFLVIDENVHAAWRAQWHPDGPFIVCQASEVQKTLTGLARLIEGWRKSGEAPHWIIVGGGIVSDMAAFAATLCNCTFSMMPTTLLAMADACVGGKTGVNFPPYGKNQLGSFAFPTAVDIWPGWLSTLSTRELRSGGAECIKHAIIIDDFALANRLATLLGECNVGGLSELLPEVIKVKAQVIERDPTETGERAILNFGHTLAHALEALSHERHTLTPMPHGYAVAYGMAFAAELSHRLLSYPSDKLDRLWHCLRASRLVESDHALEKLLGVSSLTDPDLGHHLVGYLLQDKKLDSMDQAIRWVLLDRGGRFHVDSHGRYGFKVSIETFLTQWKAFINKLSL